jgi:hypothetical protein
MVVVLCGCEGEIGTPGMGFMNFGVGGSGGSGGNGGGDQNGAGGGGSIGVPMFNPQFNCNPATAAVTPTSIKRLAKAHYLASLNEFFSALSSTDRAALIAAVQPQIDQIPEDQNTFSTRTDDLLTQSHVDATFEVAFQLATSVEANTTYANALMTVCGSGSTASSLSNATCLKKFVDHFGAKAFRRPVTAAEETDFMAFAGTLGSDALAGLISRFLTYPDFYYLMDNNGTLLAGTEGVDATYQLTPYEQLARLTLMFWDAPPDEALFAQATTLDFETALTTVLEDPRAKAGVADFFRQWLQLDKVPQLPSMDTPAFETFAAGENIGQPGHNHRGDMIQEVLDMGTYFTLTQPARYDDLLTTPYSFATTDDLAHLYGVAKWDGDPQHMVSLPNGRAGLLSRAAMLVSGSESTRPIVKGHEVRMQVLCDALNPPPASLMIKPLQPDTTKTMRQIVETATASATCQQCHGQMNPLGFSSEDYDSLGRPRTMEQKFDDSGALVNTLPINSGVTTGVFNGDAKPMRDINDVAADVVATGKGQQCIVRQVFRFTYGRNEVDSTDGCGLENIRGKLVAQGGNLKEMFKELARGDAFRERRVQ